MGQESTTAVPAGPEPTDTTPPTTTPTEPQGRTFDEQYVKTLRTENADWRTKYQSEAQQRTTLESERDAAVQNRTAVEQERDEVRQSLTTVTNERDEAVSKLERYEVAAEAGIDLDMAPRLQGKDRAELLEDAKKLRDKFGSSRPSWDGGPRNGTPAALPEDATPLQRMSHAYGGRQ